MDADHTALPTDFQCLHPCISGSPSVLSIGRQSPDAGAPAAVRRTSMKAVFTLVAVALVGLASGVRAAPNEAAAFGWKGFAETNLDVSALLGGNHTILLRFMPQYTMAGAGPILTSAAGDYALGVAAFSSK